MANEFLQICTFTDLYRFHRYVRNNNVQGIVRQNQFVANARNTLMLVFALPLETATLEIHNKNTELLPFNKIEELV